MTLRKREAIAQKNKMEMSRVQDHHQPKGIQLTNFTEFIWTDEGVARPKRFLKLLFFSLSLKNKNISKSSRA